LIRRWERARQGDGQLVLIVGEPGIGKSRLIEEFHTRLREMPHTWVEWTCSQLEALETVDATHETLFEAEVNRLAGEIALMQPNPNAAKAQSYFERALAVARQQQAKSWELRAAMSLARLWRSQGKLRQARELLHATIQGRASSTIKPSVDLAHCRSRFFAGSACRITLLSTCPSLLNQAIQHYSCFISYSAKDDDFAKRIRADLQNSGVRCWFAPHDMPIGGKICHEIDAAIRLRDKERLAAPRGGGWLARIVGRKSEVASATPATAGQATGTTIPVATSHNADEYNWSGFSCPYCGASSFVSGACGHLACNGTAELRNGRHFHQCFCGHAGFISGTITAFEGKRLSVEREVGSAQRPIAESQQQNSRSVGVALPSSTHTSPATQALPQSSDTHRRPPTARWCSGTECRAGAR
jgi:hypothetical protein